MSADFKELEKFRNNIQRLNDEQKEIFLESCCKELSSRLLSKVINDTKSVTGTLRRGWTVSTHEEAESGKKVSSKEWCDRTKVVKNGSIYRIDVINPVEYAQYYEYGHRTRNHTGWVDGHFVLTVAESELNSMTEAILAKKLKKFMKEAFE